MSAEHAADAAPAPATGPAAVAERHPREDVGHWLSREASQLAFNRRVLAQAQRADVPLLERLRYVTIVSSNMDEFFEVRFPDTLEALRESPSEAAKHRFADLATQAHELIDEQYRVFNEEVMPALAREGLHVLNHAERNAAQRRWVREFFEQQVRPLLVPVALDPAHPFPVVANKSLNFIMRLEPLADDAAQARAEDAGAVGVAILKVPRALPRVVRLPDHVMSKGQQGFALLTSIIRAHLADLLPGRTVQSFSQFRVTRDSDLEVDEDDVTNLRQALRSGLTTRHFGRAIRLEVVRTCPAELSELLLEQFELPRQALYAVNGPVNLVRLNQLIELASADRLRFPPFEAGWPSQQWPRGVPVFEQLAHNDVLMHHPFQSFDPVVQFLREAVEDPEVLAIKQTVYRTGAESVLMELLIEAVRRGKDVMVVLELKARFDEEANINWAERLEAVGVQVVYGLVGLKTHAKLLLVTRRERRADGKPYLKRYAHLSTGNYNPKTARLYTDVGMLTANPEMTADVDGLFVKLASLVAVRELRHLVPAPTRLHARLLAHLATVAAAARRGEPARVVVKVNALTDEALMDALEAASQAGAQIDLIVRGACMLRPGVSGRSDNIRVRSVVGRFLEHTRVLYFRWGPRESDEVLYLSSADWMSRNMFRRVEAAWPVRDRVMRQRVIDEMLVPYLMDTRDAWQLDSDGRYERVADGLNDPSQSVGAQAALLALHAAAGQEPA
ncbi:MAG: polyphosphate kinase 1 [Rubrivivax sp.]|nr:polyphosphate kinase 1 [Rubrivivax sp.]